MNPTEFYVYGAGGHGQVVADVCIAAKLSRICGFIDDDPEAKGRQVLGGKVVGDTQWLSARAREQSVGVVLGIGDNRARAETYRRLVSVGLEVLTPVHPNATVAASADLGRGTVVMAGAVINPGTRVGEGAIINTGAVVEHDNQIEAFAHLSANATTGGTVSIGFGSHLGLGAVVLPGIAVGAHTVVGAGAVVTRHLPDDVVAAGVPARIIRHLADTSEGAQ